MSHTENGSNNYISRSLTERMRLVGSLSLALVLLLSQTVSACTPDRCDLCNSEQTCSNGQCSGNGGGVVTPPPTPVLTPEQTPEVTPEPTPGPTPESTPKPEPTPGPTPGPTSGPNIPTEPLPGTSPVERLLSEEDWNTIFPHRWYVSAEWKKVYKKSSLWYYPEMEIDYYSYRNFIEAANTMADAGHGNFLNEPGTTEEERKRELCAFLANIGHETGHGTDGLFYREELTYERTTVKSDGQYRKVGSRTDYRMGTTPIYFRDSSALAGNVRFNSASYHGRGPIQLSWAYNYGDFSKAVFGDPQVLLENPDRLLDEPKLGISAAIWFWMTQPDYRMTHNCHKCMYKSTSSLQPWGFGRTIMAINGGFEADGQEDGWGDADKKVTRRIKNYRRCAQHFNIPIGVNGEQLDTKGLKN